MLFALIDWAHELAWPVAVVAVAVVFTVGPVRLFVRAEDADETGSVVPRIREWVQ